jgi:hypothetical protein
MYQPSGLDLSTLPTMCDLPSEEVGEPYFGFVRTLTSPLTKVWQARR